MSAYSWLLVSVVMGVVRQLLLKQGMSKRPGFRVRDLLALVGDWTIITGFGCYGIATLLYLQALAALDLSVAYPTLSLGYVLIIILSRVLFKEPVGLTRSIAVIIICLGVVLIGLGSNGSP